MKIISISQIGEAISALKAGLIVNGPTDTVFGAFADAMNKDAVKKIYDIKGTGFSQPLSFACRDVDEIGAYADINYREKGKIKELLQSGSHYTFVLRKKKGNPSLDMLARDGKIGIRIIRHPVISLLTKHVGPIITTSANFHNEPAPKDFQSLMESEFSNSAYINLNGKCYYGKPSIVYDLTNGRILRE